jgi:hypothetical protein
MRNRQGAFSPVARAVTRRLNPAFADRPAALRARAVRGSHPRPVVAAAVAAVAVVVVVENGVRRQA